MAACCWLFPDSLFAAAAEKPIHGGLGIEFGTPVAADALGAELAAVPGVSIDTLVPGRPLPWRRYLEPVLPHPFRGFTHDAFVMLDEFGKPLQVVATVASDDCDEHMPWLTRTLAKKYEVRGPLAVAAQPPFEQALQIVALGRSVSIQCGPHMRFEYVDTTATNAWRSRLKVELAAYEREQSDIEKRRMVLERRRARRFANQFTLGDQFRLDGAFGIEFGTPFAKHSSKTFPVDETFHVALPNLPEPFAGTDIALQISPEKHPITIRGTFASVSFDQLRDALRAKYGTPSKATERHIIHPVGANRAILRKVGASRVELVFIDTLAQQAQRERRWRKESEGL